MTVLRPLNGAMWSHSQPIARRLQPGNRQVGCWAVTHRHWAAEGKRRFGVVVDAALAGSPGPRRRPARGRCGSIGRPGSRGPGWRGSGRSLPAHRAGHSTRRRCPDGPAPAPASRVRACLPVVRPRTRSRRVSARFWSMVRSSLTSSPLRSAVRTSPRRRRRCGSTRSRPSRPATAHNAPAAAPWPRHGVLRPCGYRGGRSPAATTPGTASPSAPPPARSPALRPARSLPRPGGRSGSPRRGHAHH